MNCKPGDLACIVGGLTAPSPSLGRVVEVIRFEGEFKDRGPVWLVRSQEPLPTNRGPKCEFHSRDAWLRPISGVPVHDEETESHIQQQQQPA